MRPATLTLADDCFVLDRDRVRHADAIALLKSRLTTVVGVEAVPVADAGGRVVAEDVIAQAPVPLHTNAAVDGYAFAHADAGTAAAEGLPVVGRAAAGHPFAGTIDDGTIVGGAVRIFTGAVLPTGTDTVAMQEDCARDRADGRDSVRIPAGLKRGANVRKAGEDVAAGTRLFAPGAVLRPQDLAALASVGIASVQVHRRLSVAILSSGDEVVPPGQPLAPGQVYDANAPMLVELVRLAGAEAHPLGIVADDPVRVEAALRDAVARHDVIVTSGGASQGEEDHLVRCLDRIGQRHLWQLAIKPGRPMSFGQLDGGGRGCVFVGLPGNPVAVFVCFLMYVYPMLRRLGGGAWFEPRRWPLPARFSVETRKTGRREFWRGTLVEGGGGGPAVEKFARDGSGLISGLRAADGLIEVPEAVGAIAPGAAVDFIPFTEWGIGGGRPA